MKKVVSQITLAVVFLILGYILTNQFKEISRNENVNTNNSGDIYNDIAKLKNQKINIQKKIDDYQSKMSEYETSVSNTNTQNQKILEDLKDSRISSGIVDAKGPGVVIDFILKNDILDSNSNLYIINSNMLVVLVNKINTVGADAVSINDIRITSRTKITESGNSILIDENKISPFKKITVKAVGNKDTLENQLNMQGAFTFDDFNKKYNVSMTKSDNISIPKRAEVFNFEYAKPVQNK